MFHSRQANSYSRSRTLESEEPVSQQNFSNILNYQIVPSSQTKYFNSPCTMVDKNTNIKKLGQQKQQSVLTQSHDTWKNNISSLPISTQAEPQSDISFAIFQGLTQARKQVHMNHTAQALHKLFIKQLELQIQMCKQLQGLTMMSMLKIKQEEVKRGIVGIQGEVEELKQEIGMIQGRYKRLMGIDRNVYVEKQQQKDRGKQGDQNNRGIEICANNNLLKNEQKNKNQTKNNQIKYNIISTVNGRIKITKSNTNHQQNVNTNTQQHQYNNNKQHNEQQYQKYGDKNISRTTPSQSRTGSYVSTCGIISQRSSSRQRQRQTQTYKQKQMENLQQEQLGHQRGYQNQYHHLAESLHACKYQQYPQYGYKQQAQQSQKIRVLQQKIHVLKNSILLTKNYYTNRQQLIQHQSAILKQQLSLTNAKINKYRHIQSEFVSQSQPISPYLRYPLTPTPTNFPSSNRYLGNQQTITLTPSPSVYTPTNNHHLHPQSYYTHKHTYTKVELPSATSRQRWPRLKSQSIIRRQSRSRGKLFKIKNNNVNNQTKYKLRGETNNQMIKDIIHHDDYPNQWNKEKSNNNHEINQQIVEKNKEYDKTTVLHRYGSLNKFKTIPSMTFDQQNRMFAQPKLKLKHKYKYKHQPKHKYSNKNDKIVKQSRQSKQKIESTLHTHHYNQYGSKNTCASSSTINQYQLSQQQQQQQRNILYYRQN